MSEEERGVGVDSTQKNQEPEKEAPRVVWVNPPDAPVSAPEPQGKDKGAIVIFHYKNPYYCIRRDFWEKLKRLGVLAVFETDKGVLTREERHHARTIACSRPLTIILVGVSHANIVPPEEWGDNYQYLGFPEQAWPTVVRALEGEHGFLPFPGKSAN
jgi:hypothetical protein